MSLASQTHTVTGTTTFTLSFPYISTEDIRVTVNGVVADFVLNDQVVDVPTAVDGDIVTIRRVTKVEDRFVDFSDILPAPEDLELNAKQLFYLIQEAMDASEGGLKLNLLNQYDAGNRRIVNLGTPIGSKDAVTKQWCETAMDSSVAKAKSYAQNALSYAQEAYNHKVTISGLYLDLLALRQVQTLTSVSGVSTLDIKKGPVAKLELTEDIHDFRIVNAPLAGTKGEFHLVVNQGSTKFSVVFPGIVWWESGPPAFLPNTEYVIHGLTLDGGAKWYCSILWEGTTAAISEKHLVTEDGSILVTEDGSPLITE